LNSCLQLFIEAVTHFILNLKTKTTKIH